ncbi:MAG TPA: hypothetical protein PLE35_12295 [Lentisphaeria bacterium]|nr:hypothetical protein [Lentisphaeria bacterium]
MQAFQNRLHARIELQPETRRRAKQLRQHLRQAGPLLLRQRRERPPTVGAQYGPEHRHDVDLGIRLGAVATLITATLEKLPLEFLGRQLHALVAEEVAQGAIDVVITLVGEDVNQGPVEVKNKALHIHSEAPQALFGLSNQPRFEVWRDPFIARNP